ncbi:hypothetical protein J6590_084830 [Homalodisca vitripennis]|nr:hypothetical protein J6590_084830 [Homalodisca vitripennis]
MGANSFPKYFKVFLETGTLIVNWRPLIVFRAVQKRLHEKKEKNNAEWQNSKIFPSCHCKLARAFQNQSQYLCLYLMTFVNEIRTSTSDDRTAAFQYRPAVMLDEKFLDEFECTKHLGLHLDRGLTWRTM